MGWDSCPNLGKVIVTLLLKAIQKFFLIGFPSEVVVIKTAPNNTIFLLTLSLPRVTL